MATAKKKDEMPEMISLHTIYLGRDGKRTEIAPRKRFTPKDQAEMDYLIEAKAAKVYVAEDETPERVEVEETKTKRGSAKKADGGEGGKDPAEELA